MCITISYVDSRNTTGTAEFGFAPSRLRVRSTTTTDAELYDAMIGIAEKRIDKTGLAAIFRKNLKP